MPQPGHHVRQCPICLKLIEHADLVVFDAGELVHQNCFVQSGGTYALVMEFLRRRAAASFCHSCLATTLHVAYDEVRKAVTALRVDREVVVRVGAECGICRQRRVTVQTTNPLLR